MTNKKQDCQEPTKNVVTKRKLIWETLTRTKPGTKQEKTEKITEPNTTTNKELTRPPEEPTRKQEYVKPRTPQNLKTKGHGTSLRTTKKGRVTKPKSVQLENNLTTLQEFLAKKAKARQATNSSHTNLTPNAAAHAENFKGEDDRGKEINGDYKVTQL